MDFFTAVDAHIICNYIIWLQNLLNCFVHKLWQVDYTVLYCSLHQVLLDTRKVTKAENYERETALMFN